MMVNPATAVQRIVAKYGYLFMRSLYPRQFTLYFSLNIEGKSKFTFLKNFYQIH